MKTMMVLNRVNRAIAFSLSTLFAVLTFHFGQLGDIAFATQCCFTAALLFVIPPISIFIEAHVNKQSLKTVGDDAVLELVLVSFSLHMIIYGVLLMSRFT